MPCGTSTSCRTKASPINRCASENVVMRPSRRTGLSVLLAVVVWFVSAPLASAAGYWTCSDGKWLAVGQPQHDVPIKSCGSHLEIPHTRLACEQAGGSWG